MFSMIFFIYEFYTLHIDEWEWKWSSFLDLRLKQVNFIEIQLLHGEDKRKKISKNLCIYKWFSFTLFTLVFRNISHFYSHSIICYNYYSKCVWLSVWSMYLYEKVDSGIFYKWAMEFCAYVCVCVLVSLNIFLLHSPFIESEFSCVFFNCKTCYAKKRRMLSLVYTRKCCSVRSG